MSGSYSALRLGEDDDLCLELLLPFLKRPIRRMATVGKGKVKAREREMVWKAIEGNVVNVASPDWSNASGSVIKETSTIKRHVKSFRGDARELALLQGHVKKYLRMYATNACFDLAFTKRYTGKHEACIITTKDLSAGYFLEHLQGTLAPLTEDEDLRLKRVKSDFSVLRSSRDGCSQLLLGPARFVNHDCQPNAHFLRLGRTSVAIRTTRAVKAGEEITISYGDHYFGSKNSECRCSTCMSKAQRGNDRAHVVECRDAHCKVSIVSGPFTIKCLCALANVLDECPHKSMAPSYETQRPSLHYLEGPNDDLCSAPKMKRSWSKSSSIGGARETNKDLSHGDIEVQYDRHRMMYHKEWPDR